MIRAGQLIWLYFICDCVCVCLRVCMYEWVCHVFEWGKSAHNEAWLDVMLPCLQLRYLLSYFFPHVFPFHCVFFCRCFVFFSPFYCFSFNFFLHFTSWTNQITCFLIYCFCFLEGIGVIMTWMAQGKGCDNIYKLNVRSMSGKVVGWSQGASL